MFRSLSTGEVVDPDWLELSNPTYWHYDVLRGLDHLRRAGVSADARVDEALSLDESKRGPDGRWPLDNVHEDEVHFPLEDGWARRAGGSGCARCGSWSGAPAARDRSPGAGTRCPCQRTG
jgi:hypothetical protein